MLDQDLKAQLAAYLQRVTLPFELVASLDESSSSMELKSLLEEITQLSPFITLKLDGQNERKPSFSICRVGHEMDLRFCAIPLGHEFTSLVLALLWAGGHPPKVSAESIAQIQALEGDYLFEIYMSLSCHNCPDVVQALSLMAIYQPKVKTVIIDGGLFQSEVDDRKIMAVPMVFLNGVYFSSGRITLEEILIKLDQDSAAKSAHQINEKAPFDMLIVGGGPAGAAAAVYAARKGIRTGMIVDRMGGQTNDTMGIENYISVLQTDGPTFASALEAHVKTVDVDLMKQQKVTELIPALQVGGLIELKLENGATVRSKSVVISTGARWRNLNVPGEETYKNRGVAYCPHCDGPLFKGKRVAVIGGGNSGVEAAIDLAGVVAHVTLLEYADQLKADSILVNKLKSLKNVEILNNAKTLRVDGDGEKVNALVYEDRTNGSEKTIVLEGVFVQIGLVPNSEFLKGTLELSQFGEIVIDDKCKTSVPGVFAAGDVTTVPFKQIVIAAGEGSKAALSAFDYLIRIPV
jgi:alkyl hydroperoxide reductase subunit F